MTNNHDYNAPEQGTSDWHVPLNENFEQIDRDVEIRDKDSNKGSYEPKDGAKFFATDTKTIYLGDGSTWNEAGTVGGGSGGVAGVRSGVVVYKDGGEVVAEGPGGVIERSNQPAQVIQNAVSDHSYVQIHGDYTLHDKIRVTDDEQIVEASNATFTAGSDTKLWEFDNVNNVRFTSGHLDLRDVGRIALDLHGVWNSHVDTYLKSVPDGTYNDHNTGTTDRCGLRIHGGGRGGAYWNTVNVTSHWHAEGRGIAMKLNKANANYFPACKLMNYDVSIDIPDGCGNVFTCLDVSFSRIGVRQRAGKWGSFNDVFGFAWIESCGTGFDVPSRNDDTNQFAVWGRYSTASNPDTTPFSDRDAMIVFDYWNGEALLGGMTLKNYELG